MLTVITGPPAAGKTTWAQAHAEPGDIVIDYDRIAQALTADGADEHDHGRLLKRVASKARTAAIHEALRVCDRIDVWLIHAIPDPDAITWYRQHGARIIAVDPGRDAVLERIARDRPASATRGVDRWYAQHPTMDADHVEARASRQW